MRIAFLFGYSMGQDVLYRTYVPANNLPNAIFGNIDNADPGMADAFFVTSAAHADDVKAIKRFIKAGKPVILDFCEHYLLKGQAFATPWGLEAIKAIEEAASIASAVVSPSKPLVDDVLVGLNENAFHLPMVIDENTFYSPELGADAVNWWGDGSMKLDLDRYGVDIAKGMVNTDYKLYNVGFHHGKAFEKYIPGPRQMYFIVVAGAPISENLESLKASAKKSLLAVAPLRDIPYNRYRSDLQYLRYAASSLPVIASILERGQPGIQVKKGVEWTKEISDLLDNPKKRKELGEAAKEYVATRSDFSIYTEAFERSL